MSGHIYLVVASFVSFNNDSGACCKLLSLRYLGLHLKRG